MPAGALTDLKPLVQLYDGARGEALPLPEPLRRLYGELRLPNVRRRPYVISNFVQSLDGVAALGIPQTSGGQISGSNPHDRLVMGLLRAIADAVVVGAGTARSVPGHLWTSDYIFPGLAEAYAELRRHLGRAELPMNVIVTARGDVDASQRVFQGEVPVIVITTESGRRRLTQEAAIDPSLIRAIEESGELSARAIIEAVGAAGETDVVLLEGGPHLMGDFFGEGLVQELFLTVSPLMAGRDGHERPGIVAGREFAPDTPVWGELASVRRADSHLFLRYAFGGPENQDEQSDQDEG
jgi:riboflavin biosynthesis pyrimidine reductase